MFLPWTCIASNNPHSFTLAQWSTWPQYKLLFGVSLTVMWKMTQWSMRKEQRWKTELQHTTVHLVWYSDSCTNMINLWILPYKYLVMREYWLCVLIFHIRLVQLAMPWTMKWQRLHFLNQARAGLRPVRAWFLKIDPVRTSVCVCVCVCVCVRPRGY